MNLIEREIELEKAIAASKIFEITSNLKSLVTILNQLFDGMKDPEEIKDKYSFIFHNYREDLINAIVLLKQIKKITNNTKKIIMKNLNFMEN